MPSLSWNRLPPDLTPYPLHPGRVTGAASNRSQKRKQNIMRTETAQYTPRPLIIPDLWEIAHLPELEHYTLGGRSARDLIVECWHIAHDHHKALESIVRVPVGHSIKDCDRDLADCIRIARKALGGGI